MIRFEEVSKRFPGGHDALKNLSLDSNNFNVSKNENKIRISVNSSKAPEDLAKDIKGTLTSLIG